MVTIIDMMYVVDQSKECPQIYLPQKCLLPTFAITNTIFLLNRLLKTCIFIRRTCISIFSKIEFVNQPKPCTQIYLQKFTTIRIVIFKKSIISDMRDRKKYMYINFQQNCVCRSVKTVRTNIFAQFFIYFIYTTFIQSALFTDQCALMRYTR